MALSLRPWKNLIVTWRPLRSVGIVACCALAATTVSADVNYLNVATYLRWNDESRLAYVTGAFDVLSISPVSLGGNRRLTNALVACLNTLGDDNTALRDAVDAYARNDKNPIDTISVVLNNIANERCPEYHRLGMAQYKKEAARGFRDEP
jgi:hypothetical protein